MLVGFFEIEVSQVLDTYDERHSIGHSEGQIDRLADADDYLIVRTLPPSSSLSLPLPSHTHTFIPIALASPRLTRIILHTIRITSNPPTSFPPA